MPKFTYIAALLLYLVSITKQQAEAQTRRLPKADQAKLEAQRRLQEKKQAIRDQSKIFLKKKLDPRTSYKKLKAMGKRDIKQRFDILKNSFEDTKKEVKGFKFPQLLKFNGLQADLVREFAQREGNYPLGTPGDFTRFQVNGGISILGIPLKVQGLFTNEQTQFRQPMNQFSVGLDVAVIKRKLERRIQARVQKLKQVYNVTEYRSLDKLYKFEQIKEIESFTQGEVKQHLGELQQLKDLEELKSLDDWQKNWQTKLEQKAKTKGDKWAKRQKGKYYQALGKRIKRNPRLAKAYQKLKLSEEDLTNPKALEAKLKKQSTAFKKHAKSTYEGKKAALKQKYAGAKGKAYQKLNQRLGKFLNTENLTMNDLASLYKNRDSLAKKAPERLLGYENMRMLENFKQGNTTEGLKQLQQAGIISVPEFLAMSLQKINLGTNYPQFTDFTLNETRIDGVGVELQPGQLHLAYYGAKNKIAIPGNNEYARRLKAYRLGIGKKEGTHLFVNHLHGQDDPATFRGDSLVTGIGDTSFFDKPRRNVVWGIDARWKWRKWELEAEFAQSLTAMDLSRENLTLAPTQVSQFFSQPITDQGNIQVGQAYALKLHYQLGESTLLHTRLARVTPGFFSLGVPYLRNDIEGWEVSIEQKLWKNQLTIAPFYGRWQDNLTQRKEATSLMQEVGLKLNITPKKLPYLALDYRKNLIQNNELNDVEILNAQAGYAYESGKVQMQTSLSTLLQETYTNLPELNFQHISIRNHTLQQVASFRFPFQASAQLNYLDQKGGREEGKWVAVGGTISYTFWGVWQNTARGDYGQNRKEGIKYNWGFESSLTFLNYYNLTLGVEKTALKTGRLLNDYEEMRAAITLSARF